MVFAQPVSVRRQPLSRPNNLAAFVGFANFVRVAKNGPPAAVKAHRGFDHPQSALPMRLGGPIPLTQLYRGSVRHRKGSGLYQGLCCWGELSLSARAARRSFGVILRADRPSGRICCDRHCRWCIAAVAGDTIWAINLRSSSCMMHLLSSDLTAGNKRPRLSPVRATYERIAVRETALLRRPRSSARRSSKLNWPASWEGVK
jgi:hypothetical protein